MLQKLILIASLFAYVVLVGCQKELEVPATPIAIVDTTPPSIDTIVNQSMLISNSSAPATTIIAF
jgi:nitrous oxide reductase accessory protein NosL